MLVLYCSSDMVREQKVQNYGIGSDPDFTSDDNCKKEMGSDSTDTSKDIDLVFIVDCSTSTTHYLIYDVQKTLKNFLHISWGSEGSLGSNPQVAVLRCSVWTSAKKEGRSSVLCSEFKNEKEDALEAVKKVRSESLKRRTNQEVIDAATILEAFRNVEKLQFRANSTRICVYIGTYQVNLMEEIGIV